VDLDSIADPSERAALRAQAAAFGQTPARLFSAPHPPRRPLLQLLRPPSWPAQSPAGAGLAPPPLGAAPLLPAGPQPPSPHGGRRVLCSVVLGGLSAAAEKAAAAAQAAAQAAGLAAAREQAAAAERGAAAASAVSAAAAAPVEQLLLLTAEPLGPARGTPAGPAQRCELKLTLCVLAPAAAGAAPSGSLDVCGLGVVDVPIRRADGGALRCAALARLACDGGGVGGQPAAAQPAAARAQPYLAVWGGAADGSVGVALVSATGGLLAPPWRARWHAAAVGVVAADNGSADAPAVVLTAGADGVACVWRLPRAAGPLAPNAPRPLAEPPALVLRGHARAVVAGALCGRARLAATADGGGRLLVHSLVDGGLLRVVEGATACGLPPPAPAPTPPLAAGGGAAGAPAPVALEVGCHGHVALAASDGSLRLFGGACASELLAPPLAAAAVGGGALGALCFARAAALGGGGAACALGAAEADGSQLLLAAGAGWLRAYRVGGVGGVVRALDWRGAPAAPTCISIGVGPFGSAHCCVAAGASGGGVGRPSVAAFALEPGPLLGRPSAPDMVLAAFGGRV
jgi:hypothetical protein